MKGNNYKENLALIQKVKIIVGDNAIDSRKNEIKLHYFIEFLATNKKKAMDIYTSKVTEQKRTMAENYMSIQIS